MTLHNSYSVMIDPIDPFDQSCSYWISVGIQIRFIFTSNIIALHLVHNIYPFPEEFYNVLHIHGSSSGWIIGPYRLDLNLFKTTVSKHRTKSHLYHLLQSEMSGMFWSKILISSFGIFKTLSVDWPYGSLFSLLCFAETSPVLQWQERHVTVESVWLAMFPELMLRWTYYRSSTYPRRPYLTKVFVGWRELCK